MSSSVTWGWRAHPPFCPQRGSLARSAEAHVRSAFYSGGPAPRRAPALADHAPGLAQDWGA
eukprot:9999603-Alexandrium_andersonii.AAC.1